MKGVDGMVGKNRLGRTEVIMNNSEKWIWYMGCGLIIRRHRLGQLLVELRLNYGDHLNQCDWTT